jgi:hypothetical protein
LVVIFFRRQSMKWQLWTQMRQSRWAHLGPFLAVKMARLTIEANNAKSTNCLDCRLSIKISAASAGAIITDGFPLDIKCLVRTSRTPTTASGPLAPTLYPKKARVCPYDHRFRSAYAATRTYMSLERLRGVRPPDPTIEGRGQKRARTMQKCHLPSAFARSRANWDLVVADSTRAIISGVSIPSSAHRE